MPANAHNVILYLNPTAVHGGAEEALLWTMRAAQLLGYMPVLVVHAPGWLTERCRAIGIPCALLPSLPDAFASENWRDQFRPWLLNGIAIAQLARKWGAEFVHSNTPRSSYHGGLGARLAHIPAVTHVHDIIRLPYQSRAKASLLSSLSDCTLVPSKAVQQAVISYAPWLTGHTHVIPYGWESDIYAHSPPADLSALFGIPKHATVIGTIAAMTPWKGQDILIKAFQQLRCNTNDTWLLIVGGAQGATIQEVYEQQLHTHVAVAGLADRVVFTGWREDVWSLMRSLDIFVHVPTSPDPLPTALLHACALGCAVIASNTGGIPEIVEDGISGVLVPAGDVESLSSTLARLLADNVVREQIRAQARQRFTTHFSLHQMQARLDAVYDAVKRKRSR